MHAKEILELINIKQNIKWQLWFGRHGVRSNEWQSWFEGRGARSNQSSRGLEDVVREATNGCRDLEDVVREATSPVMVWRTWCEKHPVQLWFGGCGARSK